jgi:hypothetical protein
MAGESQRAALAVRVVAPSASASGHPLRILLLAAVRPCMLSGLAVTLT